MSQMLALLMGTLNSDPIITLSNLNVSDTGPSPSTARYTLESDGDIISEGVGGVNDEGDWIIPRSAAPGTYQVRATLVTGDTPTGTLGSWVALTTTRSWILTQSGSGLSSCELTIEIRKGAGPVLGSCTVTLTASVL